MVMSGMLAIPRLGRCGAGIIAMDGQGPMSRGSRNCKIIIISCTASWGGLMIGTWISRWRIGNSRIRCSSTWDTMLIWGVNWITLKTRFRVILIRLNLWRQIKAFLTRDEVMEVFLVMNLIITLPHTLTITILDPIKFFQEKTTKILKLKTMI